MGVEEDERGDVVASDLRERIFFIKAWSDL
jgi:hypothetical protein